MKKVILIILTLCSLFIYSCDGSNDPGLMITPQDILTRPDPSNENTIYGTYKIKEFKDLPWNFTSIEGRAVISRDRFMVNIFWEEPGIGKMNQIRDKRGRVGFDRYGVTNDVHVTIEEDSVRIEVNNCVVKGEKINDGINDDVLSWFPWSENTPLSETMDSTWDGTYSDVSGTITRHKNGREDKCLIAQNESLMLQTGTKSIFYGLHLLCTDNLTEKEDLTGIGMSFNYDKGFSEGNWGGLSQPIRIDNQTIEINMPNVPDTINSYFSGKVRVRKKFDVLLILRSDYFQYD